MEKLAGLDTVGDIWKEAMIGSNYPSNHPVYEERVVWQLLQHKDLRRAQSLIRELPYTAKRERWQALCSLADGHPEEAADALVNAILLSLEEHDIEVRAECLAHLGRLPEDLVRRAVAEISRTAVLDKSDAAEKNQARLVGDVPDMVAAKNQTTVDHSEELLRFMLNRPTVGASETIERAARATALTSGPRYHRHTTAAALAALERAVKEKSIPGIHTSLVRIRNAIRRVSQDGEGSWQQRATGNELSEAVKSVLIEGGVNSDCVGRILRALGCDVDGGKAADDNDDDDPFIGGNGRESLCDRPGNLDMTNTYLAGGTPVWGFPEPVRIAGLDGRISSSSAYSCGPEFEVTGETCPQRREPTVHMMLNAMDFKLVAKGKLPQESWDYLYSGAGDEFTFQENEAMFSRIAFVPRVLRNVTNVTCTTTVLGNAFDVPFYVTGMAMGKLFHEDGEKCMASGVSKCGVAMGYMVPTLASCGLRSIVSSMGPALPRWYQLCAHPDASVTDKMITRIINSDFTAMFITVDCPGVGLRERDMRHKVAQNGGPQVAGYSIAVSKYLALGMDWDTVAELAKSTKTKAQGRGKDIDIFIKGISAPADAVKAYTERDRLSIRGIVISNHGARQIDTMKSAVQLLYECTRALKKAGWRGREDPQFSVFMDGGVRRGTDVLKCVALGARAVGTGRPFMTAMAAFGEEGIARFVRILHEEIITTMRLLGCHSLEELTEDFLDTRALDFPLRGYIRSYL
ncbi:Cytochrome b2, mitochondrial precursor [Perkinsus chesapeaki]|uniref:Cytochrome b2, mitochondrial n=1 Tax=Perkinsus chesapeaki TaxID=330153 RepID=A0A7J6MNP4_PERCH|nr:Cytochrome b2, mitochondrial precursor [Perkinsus chesapeaki]